MDSGGENGILYVWAEKFLLVKKYMSRDLNELGRNRKSIWDMNTL